MAQADARERDIRRAAIDLLKATGEFDDVYAYSMPEEQGQAAGDLKAAVVLPISGSDSLEYDDVGNGRPLCKLTFHIVVMVRNDDPQVRDETAEMLLSFAKNAVNGKSLAGLTFPATTIVRNHQWVPEKPPERQIRCVVQASYETPGWTDYNTAE